MAKCWTCGSSVSDLCYRCSKCEDALRDIESSLSEGFAALAEIQERGFKQLSADLFEIATILEWGFGELIWQLHQQTEVLRSIDHTLKTPSETKANEWRLHAEELRRRGVLEESEEFFLKALNEYRLDYRIYVGFAETYLQMNKFDKAKIFLEKSLPHAPKGSIEISGETELEKSLPHAPEGSIEISEGTRKIKDFLQQGRIIDAIKEYRAQTGVGLAEAKDAIERMAASKDVRPKNAVEQIAASQDMCLSSAGRETASDFDWKSYSYRLIGHIYACEEDHIKALEALHLAIKLSPNYTDGLYDFAQYISLASDDVVERVCSQTFREWGRNWALKNYNLVCLLALQKAVEVKPVYFYLAQKEKNFDRRRKHVELALKNLSDNACGHVETIAAKINCEREEIDGAISEAKRRFRDAELESSRIYEDAKSKLKLAKDKVASGDYLKILEAEKIANESYSLFEKSKDKARSERDRFNDIVESAFNFGEIAGMSAVLAFLLGIGGCVTRFFWIANMARREQPEDAFGDCAAVFFLTGFVSFFIIAIGIVLYQIYNIYIEKPLFKKS